MHSRNLHSSYDFKLLIQINPELGKYVRDNKFGVPSIDFAHPEAVKALNQAILKKDYGIKNWSIPKNYLCPPIPGRADYIHFIADLLNLAKGQNIKGLDIGVGANCLYPIIGHSVYGWSFVGSDIDPVSVASAEKNVLDNYMRSAIEIRLQQNSSALLTGIIKPHDRFHFTMSNPPFHSSAEEANRGTVRKWKGLGKKNETALNFGGKPNELWCEGGEKKFIQTLIDESRGFKDQIQWFTCLVSKESNLPPILKHLDAIKVSEHKIFDMNQGQKKSRMIAWTFGPVSNQ